MKKIPKILIGIAVVFIVLLVFAFILEKVEENKYEKEDREALSKISVKVPKKFTKSEYSSSKHYFYYKDDTSCSFDVEVETSNYKNYKDGKDYLEDRTYITLKDKVSEIEEIDLNNYKWHSLTVEKNGNTEYHYATIKENNIYELEFRIDDYTNGESPDNYCASIKDEIISSVKLK